VTRALVRTVLSRYASIGPEGWIFSTDEYGRPAIANQDTSCPNLTFHISHTQALIILGVTCNRDLGVDVENICAREASVDIADRYFATSEVSEIMALPQNRQQYRFFEYWTFKKSYINARGLGLSLPLDGFWFNLSAGKGIEFAAHPSVDDSPDNWHFWQFQPPPKCIVAVCAQQIAAQTSLLVRRIVPMRSEELVCVEFLRASQ